MSLVKKIGRFQTVAEPGPISAGPGAVTIEVDTAGRYSAATPTAPITVTGAVSRLDVKAADYARIDADVFAESFGNLALSFGNNSRFSNFSAYASSGGFGNVTISYDINSVATVWLRGSGDVGNVTMRARNLSGSATVDIETSGNIGAIRLDTDGAYSEARVSARTFGGEIAKFDGTWKGASASGSARLSAFADAAGNGGNIGDIIVRGIGGSADPDVEVVADGALDADGIWLGGGRIGDIRVEATGHSAEVSAGATAYSGGSIGNITGTIYGVRHGSAEIDIDAVVYGAADKIGTIGNINVTVRSTLSSDASAQVSAAAFGGGDIGNVTMRATDRGSYSTGLDLYLNANAGAAGGGNIGNITLSNLSFRGSTFADIAADSSIGNISLEYGPGVHAGTVIVRGTADVGNIGVRFDRNNLGKDTPDDDWRIIGLRLDMTDGVGGSEVGRITLTGGSDRSFYGINQTGAEVLATSVEALDASRFEGRLAANLGGVDEGTTIRASRGGTDIRGTQGEDRITLGAGADIVRLDPTGFSPLTASDVVLSFTVTGARLDKLDVFGTPTLDATVYDVDNLPAELADGSLLRFVIPEDGAGVDPDGDLFTLAANAKATIVAATSATARTWYVFELAETDGVAGDWDTATLLAEVQASHGIASLTADNFL